MVYEMIVGNSPRTDMHRILAAMAILLASVFRVHGQGEIKRLPIDAIPTATLLSLRLDTKGQLFVGTRDFLLVYEPNDKGDYPSRKLLHRFPATSDINDIEIRGNDLYVATRSALYVIPDGLRKRYDLQPKKLIWGVPRGDPNQGFRALAWGPEGDLYFAVSAEEQQYWTFFSQPAGAKTPYSGTGGVFRCKPDGSDLRVVARGLTNVDGLVFDRHWNLFACDHDRKNRGRLLYVTPHACFDDLLPPMLDVRRTSRIAALSYRDDLLIARGNDSLRLPIEPNGTSFRTMERAFFEGKRPTAITVGHDRRLFAILGQSELVRLTSKEDRFEPYDAAEASAEKLWQELNEPSWPRRYRAHIEMTRRGGDFLKLANKKLLDARGSDPAMHHLIWLAAKSGQGSLHLLSLINHTDPQVRVQAIRALTEFPEQLRDEPVFTKPLLDDHPQVQHAALSAFINPMIAWSRPAYLSVERGPAVSADPTLQQTAALLLARKLTPQELEGICERVNDRLRLVGLTAVGYRLTLPNSTKSLSSHLPLKKFADELAYVIEYADGKVDLRDHGRLGTFTLAEHWKADKQTDEQNRLFKLLRKMCTDRNDEARVRAEYLVRQRSR
jgi:hypothetical protein